MFNCWNLSKNILMVSLCACLSACSALRGLDHKASVPSPYLEEQQTPEKQQFSSDVANAMPYSTLYVSSAPDGNDTEIQVQGDYINGLGQQCRKAFFVSVNGERRQFAVCRGSDNTWRYVEPLI